MRSRLEVIFDSQVFSLQRRGGISRYVIELVQALNRQGRVQAAVLAPIWLIDELPPAFPIRGWGKLPGWLNGVHPVLPRANRLLSELTLRALKHKILHRTFYQPSFHQRGVARVVTVHDMIHELFPDQFPDSAHISSIKRQAVESSDRVLCVSNTTKQDLMNLWQVPESKIHLTLLGPNQLPEPNPSAITDASFRPFVLFVGRRDGYKNFRVLLDALSLPGCADLTLVAFGGSDWTTQEQDILRSLGLADRVHRVSGDDQRLATFYALALAVVVPSQYEGFGMPVLEAWQYGCPVLCARAGSLPEIAGAAGKYFEPADPASLAGCLTEIQEPDIRKHWGELGRLRRQHFSWDTCALQTQEAYEQLLA